MILQKQPFNANNISGLGDSFQELLMQLSLLLEKVKKHINWEKISFFFIFQLKGLSYPQGSHMDQLIWCINLVKYWLKAIWNWTHNWEGISIPGGGKDDISTLWWMIISSRVVETPPEIELKKCCQGLKLVFFSLLLDVLVVFSFKFAGKVPSVWAQWSGRNISYLLFN